ncbi:MAG: NUDIX domain-containing protein [Acidimicrobiales bacterium]
MPLASAKFRKLGERSVYQSALLHVALGTFEGPGGEHFDRDLVHHPGAVVVVPFDEATGEVVLVRQYRGPLDSELLEVPAGKRDVEGEPNEATAARELAEEAGLEAGRLELIGHFFNSPGFSDEESWCFLARDLRQVPDSRHGIEEQHMTVERHPLSGTARLVRSGEITDAKTIVALFLAQAALA